MFLSMNIYRRLQQDFGRILFLQIEFPLVNQKMYEKKIMGVRFRIFSRKYLFIVEANPAGLVTILPSQSSCEGVPDVPHPSHPLTVLHTPEESFICRSSFLAYHCLLSSLRLAVTWFLRFL